MNLQIIILTILRSKIYYKFIKLNNQYWTLWSILSCIQSNFNCWKTIVLSTHSPQHRKTKYYTKRQQQNKTKKIIREPKDTNNWRFFFLAHNNNNVEGQSIHLIRWKYLLSRLLQSTEDKHFFFTSHSLSGCICCLSGNLRY